MKKLLATCNDPACAWLYSAPLDGVNLYLIVMHPVDTGHPITVSLTNG